MIPIYLNSAAVRIMLAGRGAMTVRRLAWLRHLGASPDVWSDAPSDELVVSAAAQITRRLPSGAEFARYDVAWIADLESAEAESVAQAARAAGVLVNVEDVAPLCDFYTPAVVRRGKLTLAAGTGGASPAVARAARERLEAVFSPAWESALDEIAKSRSALRVEGAGFHVLVTDARERLAQLGLI